MVRAVAGDPAALSPCRCHHHHVTRLSLLAVCSVLRGCAKDGDGGPTLPAPRVSMCLDGTVVSVPPSCALLPWLPSLRFKCASFPPLRADYTFVLACNSDEHYCLQFPPSPTAGQGDSPPTLCLPRPEVCGAAAGSCCPLTGDTENGSQRCNDQDTLCLAPNSTTIYGRQERRGRCPCCPAAWNLHQRRHPPARGAMCRWACSPQQRPSAPSCKAFTPRAGHLESALCTACPPPSA